MRAYPLPSSCIHWQVFASKVILHYAGGSMITVGGKEEIAIVSGTYRANPFFHSNRRISTTSEASGERVATGAQGGPCSESISTSHLSRAKYDRSYAKWKASSIHELHQTGRTAHCIFIFRRCRAFNCMSERCDGSMFLQHWASANMRIPFCPLDSPRDVRSYRGNIQMEPFLNGSRDDQ